VLIAREMLLTDLSRDRSEPLRGIALATGGATSHATILAKSFEIPTVVGVEHLLDHVVEGDEVIVDGNGGVVYRQPGPEVVREYERMEGDYRAFNEQLELAARSSPRYDDGRPVACSDANVGLARRRRAQRSATARRAPGFTARSSRSSRFASSRASTSSSRSIAR
jgi:phosphotransferase system enzyme I (PtsI)